MEYIIAIFALLLWVITIIILYKKYRSGKQKLFKECSDSHLPGDCPLCGAK